MHSQIKQKVKQCFKVYILSNKSSQTLSNSSSLVYLEKMYFLYFVLTLSHRPAPLTASPNGLRRVAGGRLRRTNSPGREAGTVASICWTPTYHPPTQKKNPSTCQLIRPTRLKTNYKNHLASADSDSWPAGRRFNSAQQSAGVRIGMEGGGEEGII